MDDIKLHARNDSLIVSVVNVYFQRILFGLSKYSCVLFHRGKLVVTQDLLGRLLNNCPQMVI